ncbi:MAG: mechanosensitive ion channel family protein [bacterium]|nr:mechanosensitive ion channel family protein [bacterium]
MPEFFSKIFYGNTIGQWSLALLIIVGALVVGKFLYWVFSSVLRGLTQKTKTKIDDIILDMIEEPIVFAVTVGGIWFGLQRLVLPENVDNGVANSLQFLIVLSITWLISRLLESLFTHYLTPLADKSKNDLDDQLLPLARKGVKSAVWALGIIVALNNAGYEVGAVIAGLGIGGLALAMAAKDTVSNVFGGFTIFTDRPFTLKDRVRVDGYDGTIEEIGIRSTRLRTLSGTLVTIPNATFSGNSVENVSLEPCRKIVLNLGLTYDTKPEAMQQAMDILREIKEANTDVEEKIIIGFNGFGDFAMNILMIYYVTKGANIIDTQTSINLEILKRFGQAKLDFAFPTQTLYNIKQED